MKLTFGPVPPMHVHIHLTDAKILKALKALSGDLTVIHHNVIDQGVVMTQVSDAVAAIDAKTNVLQDTVTSQGETLAAVATELGELKDAIGNAVTANDLAAMQVIASRLGALADSVSAQTTTIADQANAADLTPETPVPGGTPVPTSEPAPA